MERMSANVWARRTGTMRLQAYLSSIASVLGHAARAAPMQAYCKGLLLPGERKSVELMAARLRPSHVRALHQSMHHVVAQAEWSDDAVLEMVGRLVLPAIERHGPICFWMLDTIAFPKQGNHSVGVARQPCGPAGTQSRCQIAVCLSVGNEHASLPVAYRLSLPQAWTDDPARCAKAGVPQDVKLETKLTTALSQIRQAYADELPRGIVLGAAEYGDDVELRSGLCELNLLYVLGVQPSTGLWLSASSSPVAESCGIPKRSATQDQYDASGGPVSAGSLALGLPARAWHKMAWRDEGQAGLRSRFAAVRVRPACGATQATRRPEEWLLIEWAGNEAEPTGYWLSNLHSSTPLKELVRAAKGRWRTSRDIQELRHDAGLGHFEGRGWRGFHHHASLSIATYGFLIAERCLFPLAQRFSIGQLALPPRPESFQARGSASRAPRGTSPITRFDNR